MRWGRFIQTMMRSLLVTHQAHGERLSQKQSYFCDFAWLWHKNREKTNEGGRKTRKGASERKREREKEAGDSLR